MDNKNNVTRKRYSTDSERLWEDGPVCPEYQQESIITYPSDYSNANGEPVFYKNEKEMNWVLPVVKSETPGFFRAYPGGLDIDQYTGEIDINSSDPGVRYTVEFSPCGRGCVAQAKVVIGGIGYRGGIFSLSRSSKEELQLKPFYYGNNKELCSDQVPSKEAPAGEYGIDPTCGENGHQGRHQKKPAPHLLGLVIDPQTGTIDLRKTITTGALGFRKKKWFFSHEKRPANGASKDFTIYYRLSTGPGGGVLHKTKFRLHFYNTAADIPEDLRARLQQQSNSINLKTLTLPLLLGMPLTYLQDSPWVAFAALLTALSSFLFLMSKAKDSNNPMIPHEGVITN
jgi:hypothetical protein